MTKRSFYILIIIFKFVKNQCKKNLILLYTFVINNKQQL